MRLPRYPIYVPSKGRADRGYTAKFLIEDGTPFKLVVEPQEIETYAEHFGHERLLVLPFRDRGSVIPARNWIREHAQDAGFARHWQLDDNIIQVERWYKGKRIRCRSGIAFAAVEDFVDRYENVALAGLNYHMFGLGKQPPFLLNHRIYSCTLFLNSLPYRWRGRYNEDTDICLQALSGGWCTVLINVFLVQKITTMRVKGGNSTTLYQGDGRLKMARSLERLWPGVVTTKRRFQRPQHIVKDDWRRFDTPLRRKADIVVDAEPNDYGLQLVNVTETQHPELRAWVAAERARKRAQSAPTAEIVP